jgi:hypothetical protein
MESKLNNLMTRMPKGMPLTSARLAQAGVSGDLAVRYARNGWLQRLARGIYQRAGDLLELHPTLRVLEGMTRGLHIGGKTALDWYGIRQYIAPNPVLLIYGWDAFQLPAWFTRSFPAEYRRKRLFEEDPRAMLGVQPHRDTSDGAMTSNPERALLEMLSEVGTRQTLDEARELAQTTDTLRYEELQRLLQACRSVKTVRLALTLGRELELPWASALDVGKLPTGSKSRWVARSRDGTIVLKP